MPSLQYTDVFVTTITSLYEATVYDVIVMSVPIVTMRMNVHSRARNTVHAQAPVMADWTCFGIMVRDRDCDSSRHT